MDIIFEEKVSGTTKFKLLKRYMVGFLRRTSLQSILNYGYGRCKPIRT